MIKLAINKTNSDIVYKIDAVVRVPLIVGGNTAGIIEYFEGTLVDTSTVPDTEIHGYRIQVDGIESDWLLTNPNAGGVSPVNNQTKSADPATTAVEVLPDSGYTGLDKVVINAANLEEKVATPTTSQQVIEPTTEGAIGLSKVTVSAVDLETKTVDPTTEEQVLTPSTGYMGMDEVTVSAVTADIDSNIVPENIAKDVTILGVTGTHSGGAEVYSGVHLKDDEFYIGTDTPSAADYKYWINCSASDKPLKYVNNYWQETKVDTTNFTTVETLTKAQLDTMTTLRTDAGTYAIKMFRYKNNKYIYATFDGITIRERYKNYNLFTLDKRLSNLETLIRDNSFNNFYCNNAFFIDGDDLYCACCKSTTSNHNVVIYKYNLLTDIGTQLYSFTPSSLNRGGIPISLCLDKSVSGYEYYYIILNPESDYYYRFIKVTHTLSNDSWSVGTIQQDSSEKRYTTESLLQQYTVNNKTYMFNDFGLYIMPESSASDLKTYYKYNNLGLSIGPSDMVMHGVFNSDAVYYFALADDEHLGTIYKFNFNTDMFEIFKTFKYSLLDNSSGSMFINLVYDDVNNSFDILYQAPRFYTQAYQFNADNIRYSAFNQVKSSITGDQYKFVNTGDYNLNVIHLDLDDTIEPNLTTSENTDTSNAIVLPLTYYIEPVKSTEHLYSNAIISIGEENNPIIVNTGNYSLTPETEKCYVVYAKQFYEMKKSDGSSWESIAPERPW